MRKRKISDKDSIIVVIIVVTTIYAIIKRDMFTGGITKPLLIDFFYGLILVLVGTAISLAVIRFAYRRNKNKKYLKYDFTKIDKMDGIEFEGLLAEYFKLQGYHVVLTPASNDYGADLVLGKDKDVIIVQAKRYTGHKVNNSAVQEIVAAMPYYKATKAMVVTNSFYTKNAKELAEANNVILWDRNDLKNIFHIVERSEQ